MQNIQKTRHKRLVINSILIFFFLFTAVNVQAQYFGQNKMRYKKLDFKVKETPHFDLYYYLKNDSLLEQLAKESEIWYELHQQVFRDTFARKNPLIIYNNHPDFQQTTAIQGQISVGTGGVTEGLKNRVVMPIMQINSQTRHVLGHELVHAFQYHSLIEGDSTNLENIGNLPLWMVEGMAEYLSIGKRDAFTAMWMRDAYLNHDIPSLRDLTETNKYFPYRYGQAFWSYIGSTYGDTVIVPLFKATAKYGYQMAIQHVFGYNERTLSNLWKNTIENTYRPLLKDTTQTPLGKVIIDKNNAGNTNVSPAISPDGKYIAFLSEKDLLSIDLYLAEAQTGKIIRKLTSKISNSHIDEFSFIESAGSFSPDSKKFAFSVFDAGRNKLLIVDVDNGNTLHAIGMGEVGEFSNIAWSPDGNSIAFSGLKEGQGDLYQYNLTTKALEQLTNDQHSEYHPAYSRDGKQLVFSTDRYSTLRGASGVNISFDLALMDLSSHEIYQLPVFPGANNLNPQFSGDDKAVYFLSNRDGYRNLYRYNIGDNTTVQLTDYFTGISGITEYSPALSVSANNDILYSYYRAQKYSLYIAHEDDFTPVAVDNNDVNFEAALLPPFKTLGVDVVNVNLRNFGNLTTIDSSQIRSIPYRPQFKLDYLASSGVGVSVGSRYGSGLSSGIQGIFSDILGRNQIFAGLAVNGEIYDFGGQFAYINQANRINWGGAISHIPFVSGLMSYSVDENQNSPTGYALSENYDIIRTFQEQAEGFVAFPFSRTKRIEAGAAVAHYSYRIDRYSTYYYADENGNLLSYYPFYSDRRKLPLDEAVDMYGADFKSFTIQQVNAAFVGDNSYFGIAAPLDGYRYRIGVEQYFGDYNFTTYTFDVRKYNRYSPVTVAARLYTYMRMGKDEGALYPLFLGYPYLIRGYESSGFYNGQGALNTSGFDLNQLMGTRIAVANFEVRIPFTGPERLALVKSKMLFSDLNFFFDAGLAWTKDSKVAFKSAPDKIGEITNPNGSTTVVYERVPAMSAGASLRVNVFGYFVIEPYYAFPFQRKDVKFGTFGLNFAPGW